MEETLTQIKQDTMIKIIVEKMALSEYNGCNILAVMEVLF